MLTVKLWGNHNTYAEPQGLQNPLRSSGNGTTPVRLDCYDGRKSFAHLSFVDTNPASNLTIVIDDVEVGRSFDTAWYPGRSQITPSRMRLRGNQLASLFLLPLIAWMARQRKGQNCYG